MTELDLLKLAMKIRSRSLSRHDKEVIDSLFFSYDQKISQSLDYLLVLLGDSMSRVHAALKIYQVHTVRIILSGGSVMAQSVKECYYYRDYLIQHGVNSNDIICEDQSTNTYENLFYSLKLITSNGESFPSVLLISSTQHLLRVSKTLDKIQEQLGKVASFYFYPTFSHHYRRRYWYLYSSVRREIVQEIEKLIRYQLWS